MARALDVIPFEPTLGPLPNWNLVIDLGSREARAMCADLAERIDRQFRQAQPPPRRIISAGGRSAAVFIVIVLPLASMRLAPTRVSQQRAAGLRARAQNPGHCAFGLCRYL
jgi:hypothetical protein